MSKLTDHEYLIFDVYGTLVDWESGIYDALQPLLSQSPVGATWSKSEAIRAFLSVESDIQAQHPSMLYSDLLAKAHEVFETRLKAAEGKDLGVTTLEGTITNNASSEGAGPSTSAASTQATSPSTHNPHTEFGNSVKRWVPSPDSSQALHDLSKRFHLIVLSNVDHASFAYTHSYLSEGFTPSSSMGGEREKAPSLSVRPSPNPHPRDLWLPRQMPNSNSPFSMILTAQDTGAYKPSTTGFLAAFEAIRSEPSLLISPGSGGDAGENEASQPSIDDIKAKTLIVAQSLTHDHVPAKRLGVSSVWIDRQSATLRPEPPSDGTEYGWKWRFETLGDMAKEVERERLVNQ